MHVSVVLLDRNRNGLISIMCCLFGLRDHARTWRSKIPSFDVVHLHVIGPARRAGKGQRPTERPHSPWTPRIVGPGGRPARWSEWVVGVGEAELGGGGAGDQSRGGRTGTPRACMLSGAAAPITGRAGRDVIDHQLASSGNETGIKQERIHLYSLLLLLLLL